MGTSVHTLINNKWDISINLWNRCLDLVEIGEPIFWQVHYDEANNLENLMAELDLVEETRD